MPLEFLLNSLGGVILLFLLSLALLLKSSDYFTEYSEKVGLALGIPQFIIGVTIVSIGTSLPELATSLFALFKHETEFIAGNVVGSNIANIFLIIGLVALVSRKMKIEWDVINIDLPLLLGSAVMTSIMMWDGVFTVFEAIICIMGFFVYVGYVVSMRTGGGKEKKKKTSLTAIFIILLSAGGVYFGAKYTMDAVIAATKLPSFVSLDINTSLIALTVVALGTSLPELVVSIMAARRKNYEVAIGNVLGSNIFNSFVVMGIPGLFGTLQISPLVLTVGIPFMLVGTVLFLVSTMVKEVSRYEGAMFLLFYILFIGKLLNLF